MDVGARSAGEPFEEIVYQFRLKIADHASSNFGIDHSRSASAEIYRSKTQRFVHRHQEVSGAQNAALRAECFPDRFAKNDAGVLDRVVLVHVEIAARGEFQIHGAVPRHERQHVIEKRDVRRDFRAAKLHELGALAVMHSVRDLEKFWR